jgi:predicted dehydrogenase/nucleoside-diphosphate-sugar epimerase
MTVDAMDRDLHVGILGAGYIADWHVKALRSVRGVRVAAVCDQDLGRARSLAERYCIPVVARDAVEMLDKQQCEAVHLLLPPDRHFSAAEQLLDAGVHAFLEKPACVRAAECEHLRDVAARRQCSVGVGHNFLFAPIYERLRDDIRQGMLGPLSEVSIVWNKELGQLRSGPFGAWMFRKSGNIVLEVGPHSVAHLLDLVGEPDALSVDVERQLELPGGLLFFRGWWVRGRRDQTQVDLRFDFGAGFPEHRIQVRGRIASATADFEAGTYVLRRHRPGLADFARRDLTVHEGRELIRQARGKLRRYLFSKLWRRRHGNDFGASIAHAVRSFYGGLPATLDERLSLGFASRVVALCTRIAETAGQAVSNDGPQDTAADVPLSCPRPRRPKVRDLLSTPPRPADTLVLGGTGFIGQALVRQMVKADRCVRLLVRDSHHLPKRLGNLPIDVIRGDIGNASDLDRALAGVSTVYHLARAHVKTWAEYERSEIGATRNVAEACLRAGVKRLIYTGSIDSLYTGDPRGVIDESTPLDPRVHRRNLYARAKAESERLLMELHSQQGLPLAIFRPGIVLGRGGSPFHWGVGMWFADSVCLLWGRGDNQLPIILADDVARALVAAGSAERVIGEVFNLVGEPLLTAREYIAELEKAAHMKIDARPTSAWRFYSRDLAKWVAKCLIRHPERRLPSYRDWQTRGHLARFDCGNAKRVLGWVPIADRDTLIEQGIVRPVREWLA